MNCVQYGRYAMTIVAIDHAPATRSDAAGTGFSGTTTNFAGVVEGVGTAGLRLAGYDAWTAGLCAAIAAGCLLGLGRIVMTLIGPVLDAVVPMNCGSSIDCPLQTL